MTDADDLRRCYEVTFSGAAGRAVLRDIAARGLVHETTFAEEALRLAFNEGRRSLALHVLRMANGAEQENSAQKKGGPLGPPFDWTKP